MRCAGQHLTILGLGESGEAAATLAKRHGARVTALDSSDPAKLAAKSTALARLGIQTVLGGEANRFDGPADLAVLSPGIDPATPLVRNIAARGIPIVGELEFAFSFCPIPCVAITGTNGKTTTTGLVETMLNGCGRRTVAAGNISPAFSAVVERAPELDLFTLEVSSFQLETIRTFHPAVSVWTNFAPNHLDRYPDLDAYRAAKLRIFERQTAADRAVVRLGENLPPIAPETTTFCASEPGADFHFVNGTICFRATPVLPLDRTRLRGLHNAENLMAALGVGLALGLPLDRMADALATYRPQPHRCELVRSLDGVDYVNDSKATNLDAMEKAIRGEERTVVLIAGGKDKGFEFDAVAPLVAQRATRAILIGEMAHRIKGCWEPGLPCEIAPSLEEAVARARAAAQPGQTVLFSPGTSSFDMFKNYIERGEAFRAAVLALDKP